ncbi:UNVERIFIED_CONTAM: hypothetical protein Sradi_6959700 [Sesamum radiatum]|uniref:Uncharacterized protein n=1 Tax=Sesamum radiatum TaxID=300843 RepID=A0AAW2JEY9_SESRA
MWPTPTGQREWAPLIATNDRKCAGIHSKRQNFLGQALLSTSRSSERATRAYAARGAAPPVRKVTPPGRLDVPRVAPR